MGVSAGEVLTASVPRLPEGWAVLFRMEPVKLWFPTDARTRPSFAADRLSAAALCRLLDVREPVGVRFPCFLPFPHLLSVRFVLRVAEPGLSVLPERYLFRQLLLSGSPKKRTRRALPHPAVRHKSRIRNMLKTLVFIVRPPFRTHFSRKKRGKSSLR